MVRTRKHLVPYDGSCEMMRRYCSLICSDVSGLPALFLARVVSSIQWLSLRRRVLSSSLVVMSDVSSLTPRLTTTEPTSDLGMNSARPYRFLCQQHITSVNGRMSTSINQSRLKVATFYSPYFYPILSPTILPFPHFQFHPTRPFVPSFLFLFFISEHSGSAENSTQLNSIY